MKTTDVAVRLARAFDAEDIAAMSRDYIEHGLPWTWTAGRIEAAIREADINVVVAGERGAISAFGIMSYPADDAHLLLFAVRQNQRRRGVGSAILRWLEEAARTAGAKRIRVECRRDNSAARMPDCAAQPACMRLVQVPSARYSMMPEAIEPTTPSASTICFRSSLSALPTAAAAPIAPNTAVG